MSILWCGGEDIDFLGTGGVVVTGNTSTNYFRTNFARSCIDAKFVMAKSTVFESPGQTSCWLSGRIYVSSMSSSYYYVGLGQAGNPGSILFGITSTTYKSGLFKYDGTTYTLLASETGVTCIAGMHKLDMQFISLGVTTTINVFLDGNLIITYNGDPRPTGLTAFDLVTCWNSLTFGIVTTEIIVADEDTRLMSLVTLYPNAVGDLNEWTGDYTAIDEAILSDSDVINTAVVNKEFNCGLSNIPAGNFICKAVKIIGRAADGTGGVALQTGIRTNGTTNLGTATVLEGVWRPVEKLYQNNPVTNNRFTIAELDALQIAFKSTSA